MKKFKTKDNIKIEYNRTYFEVNKDKTGMDRITFLVGEEPNKNQIIFADPWKAIKYINRRKVLSIIKDFAMIIMWLFGFGVWLYGAIILNNSLFYVMALINLMFSIIHVIEFYNRILNKIRQ